MRRANEIAGERRLPESNRWKVPVAHEVDDRRAREREAVSAARETGR